MQPIFKYTIITHADLGPTMAHYAELNNYLQKGRRALVGSYYADRYLLATPLLRWYLQKGLVVTKVHQFIQFTPNPCFKAFEARVPGWEEPI